MNLLSSYIFLYEDVPSNNNCQVPVAQMISEKPDTLKFMVSGFSLKVNVYGIII